MLPQTQQFMFGAASLHRRSATVKPFAPTPQLSRIEHQPSKLRVAGSNPAGVATPFNDLAVMPHPFLVAACRESSPYVSTVPYHSRQLHATWMRHELAQPLNTTLV